MLSKVGLVWVIIASMIGGILLDIKIAEAYAYTEVLEITVAEMPKQEVMIEVVYSKDGIERLIRETFPENPDLAVAIAKAESGESLKATAFNPESHKNCNGSYGVFQIACVHDKNTNNLYDVEYNIKKARAIYLKEGWRPWGGYTSGGYKKFL